MGGWLFVLGNLFSDLDGWLAGFFVCLFGGLVLLVVVLFCFCCLFVLFFVVFFVFCLFVCLFFWGAGCGGGGEAVVFLLACCFSIRSIGPVMRLQFDSP